MIKIVLEKRTFLIASSWGEVNLRATLFYLKYYYSRLSELITTNEAGESFIKDEIEWLKMNFGLLQGLFGLTANEFTKLLDSASASELVNEHKVTDFMIHELKPMKQVLKKLNGWIGPYEFLYITTAEFALADIQFLKAKAALKENNEAKLLEHLKNFTAILYRPLGENLYGDLRQEFDKNNVEHRVKKLKARHKWLMMAAMLWYESYRVNLPNMFPDAFGGGNGDAEKMPDWQAAMLTVAESGTFGNFFTVEKTPAVYFIKEINRKQSIMKEQLANMKRSNT